MLGASGGVSVGYGVSDLTTHIGSGGTVVIDGQLTYGSGKAPQPVGLFSYLLTGTITYADGTPVKDAIVTTRTNDHKFWTYSTPTDAQGKYTAFLVASDQAGDNPVPMTVEVAVGTDAYSEPLNDFVNFAELQSATLDIQLPAAAGAPLVKSSLNPQAIPGRGVRGHARRRRRQGAPDQAGERHLAGHERPLQARPAELGSGSDRPVLGGRPAVLLDIARTTPGRADRRCGLPVLAARRRAAEDRDAHASALNNS